MALADLHLHSTASDGLLSPTEIVINAKALGLKLIALTDHDTTTGVAEAISAGASHGIQVTPGVELSCETNDGTEVHLLGYKFDILNSPLQELLTAMGDFRAKRLRDMLRLLRKQGMNLVLEDIYAAAPGVRSLGRPHIARALVAKGYAESISEGFSEWLGRGRPCYVQRYKLDPYQGVAAIKQAGGLVFIAHPGLMPPIDLASLAPQWGVDGLEVYHPAHSQEQVGEYLELAHELHVYISGGSDFHGGPNQQIGRATIAFSEAPWLLT